MGVGGLCAPCAALQGGLSWKLQGFPLHVAPSACPCVGFPLHVSLSQTIAIATTTPRPVSAFSERRHLRLVLGTPTHPIPSKSLLCPLTLWGPGTSLPPRQVVRFSSWAGCAGVASGLLWAAPSPRPSCPPQCIRTTVPSHWHAPWGPSLWGAFPVSRSLSKGPGSNPPRLLQPAQRVTWSPFLHSPLFLTQAAQTLSQLRS